MEKRTKIKEVNFFKDGVSDGRAWSMHTVIDEDGWRYTSFQAEPWHTYMERGEECVIPYEEKPSTKTNPKTGKPYMNKTIVEPRKGGGKNGVKELENVNGQIVEKLFTKLNLLQAEVEKIGKMVSQMMNEVDERVEKEEELPPF